MKNFPLQTIILLLSFFMLESALAATSKVKASNLDSDSLALLISAQEGTVDKCKSLITEGAPINVVDDYGRTPLHVAIEFGHADIAKILIDSGANIEARTGRALHLYFGWTPLMFAAYWGNLESVDLLVKAGADLNAYEIGSRDPGPVISITTIKGRTTVAKQLIEYGADVNATTENRLISPLFLATRFNHFELVKLFIDEGANVNALDKESYTPLHAAAITGNTQIAKLLLDNGANIEAKSTGGTIPGETPLHLAASNGNLEIAQLLVSYGADVNSSSNLGYTPLRRAIDGQNQSLASYLLSEGADVNATDSNGLTALHIVAQTFMVSLAEELIQLGGDVNALDKNLGFTPLDYAQDGELEMIELLEANDGTCTSC